ncbi:MAG: nicotinate-nucleotide adenylyltransferase [Anaerolineales bacterium]
MARLERLGIFGGTFDPPHIGHLILAEEARAQLHLSRVLWVLTPNPPHKTEQRVSPLDVRLSLLQAAIAENPAFELSRVEIDRPPPHYAADTVQILADAYPQADLIYLMGADSLRDLPLWKEPHRFLGGCHALGVMRRPGAKIPLERLETQLPGITHKVMFIEAPLLQIASSHLRARIATGKPFRYFLPAAVYHAIVSNHLYSFGECYEQRSTS